MQLCSKISIVGGDYMICVNVEQILKKQKKSKYWFVKNMGGSYQSLTNLMNNATTSIHFETLDKMCEIFDCEPRRYYYQKENHKKKERWSK